jgi:hypothetical protein
MIESLLKDSIRIKCNVKMLREETNDNITLNKYQIFLLAAQMFMGLLPRQTSSYDMLISFASLMTTG